MFHHPAILSFSTADSKNQRPNKSSIGKSYFHPKTRRIYRVTDFVWNSSTDEWNIVYSRTGCDITFTRTLAEFNDPNRFIEIDNSVPEED